MCFKNKSRVDILWFLDVCFGCPNCFCNSLSENELALIFSRPVHHFFVPTHKRPELAPSLIFFLNSSEFELNGRIKSSLLLWRENVIPLSRSLPGPLFRHRSLLIERSRPVDFLSLIAELCVYSNISHLSEYQHLPPKSDLLVNSGPIFGYFWAYAP